MGEESEGAGGRTRVRNKSENTERVESIDTFRLENTKSPRENPRSSIDKLE